MLYRPIKRKILSNLQFNPDYATFKTQISNSHGRIVVLIS